MSCPFCETDPHRMDCPLHEVVPVSFEAEPTQTIIDVTEPPYNANNAWPKPATEAGDAIQAALDENPKSIIYLPPGIYRCSKTLTVRSTQTITGPQVGANFRQLSTLAFSPGIPGILILDNSTTGGAQESCVEYLIVWGLYKQTTQNPSSGIEIHAGVRINRVRVTGFKGNGIWIQAGVPETRANLWQLRDCQLDTNDGNGLLVEGGDANGGLAEEVSVTANKGYGIRDDSGLGNTYVACHTRTNGIYGTDQGGAYRIGAGGPGLSGVNASVLIGCYQEGDQPSSFFGDQVMIFGGTWAGPLKGGQRIITGNANIRFQSGGGLSPPLSSMGNRNLTGPAFSIQNWAGVQTLAMSQDGSLWLGIGPGETIPPLGTPDVPRMMIWTSENQPAARYAFQKAGAYVAPVGEVMIGANGSGYGAGYLSYRTVGAGGKYTEALRLQQARVTIGQGGLQLPSLTKLERTRLSPPPKKGLMIWGEEESALLVYDGTSWNKVPSLP